MDHRGSAWSSLSRMAPRCAAWKAGFRNPSTAPGGAWCQKHRAYSPGARRGSFVLSPELELARGCSSPSGGAALNPSRIAASCASPHWPRVFPSRSANTMYGLKQCRRAHSVIVTPWRCNQARASAGVRKVGSGITQSLPYRTAWLNLGLKASSCFTYCPVSRGEVAPPRTPWL